jgi:hypothetical protein
VPRVVPLPHSNGEAGTQGTAAAGRWDSTCIVPRAGCTSWLHVCGDCCCVTADRG